MCPITLPALKVYDSGAFLTLCFLSVRLTSVRERSTRWLQPEGSDAASSATSKYTDMNPTPVFPFELVPCMPLGQTVNRLCWVAAGPRTGVRDKARNLALHGAREVSRALRTYQWLSRAEDGDGHFYDG